MWKVKEKLSHKLQFCLYIVMLKILYCGVFSCSYNIWALKRTQKQLSLLRVHYYFIAMCDK